jgi:drug/metabolite transporter (DMT)-like permease
MGLFAICGYNTLQYLALKTSSPLNATLVASSMPIWMLLVGRLGYGAAVKPQSLAGALLSLSGVLVVLGQGDWARLQALELVPGDAWMLLAAFVWSCYSWLLTRAPADDELRPQWAHFLLAQIAFGLAWSGVMTAGEWLALPAPAVGTNTVQWGWPLAAALLFVAVGPSLLAYRSWGIGVARVGPTVAGFFNNLTPLFAAIMSTKLLGEMPRLYHAAGFVLIVGGILVSSRR